MSARSVLSFTRPHRRANALLGVGNFGLRLLTDQGEALSGYALRVVAMKRTIKAHQVDADVVVYYRHGHEEVRDTLQRVLEGTPRVHLALAAGARDAAHVASHLASNLSREGTELHIVLAQPFSWEDRARHRRANELKRHLEGLPTAKVHVLESRHSELAVPPALLHEFLDDLTRRAAAWCVANLSQTSPED